MKYFLIIVLILLIILGYYIYNKGYYIYNKYFMPKSIFEEIKLPMPLYQP